MDKTSVHAEIAWAKTHQSVDSFKRRSVSKDIKVWSKMNRYWANSLAYCNQYITCVYL